MIFAILLVGVVALFYVAVALWHGSKQATEEGSWPVAGWPTVEVKGPDGQVKVASPELDRLVAQRHAHEDETDPNLEAWALSEIDAMREAFLVAEEAGDE